MMTVENKMKILILDDEKQFTEELSNFFSDSDFEPFEANTPEEGWNILQNQKIDLLILDVRLLGADGLDILKEVKSRFPNVEVVIVSAHGDMDTVIKAMRFGAFDYLRKPFRFIDMQIVLERTQRFLRMGQKLKQMEEKNSLISKALEDKIERNFIGVSPQIKAVFEQAVTAANYPDANVLITGESGTGKENIARIIHFSSIRKQHLLCTVNSSAITESLLESEFFGHKKGSFTGAISDKMGFFEVCNQGTLFLDEIADMPVNLQAKILRATEEKVITRVGDTLPIHTDFRIISATNRNIAKLVEKKKFRLDLLHRLNTIHIHIPALRERPEDIRPLLTHFIDLYAAKFNKPNLTVSEKIYQTLQEYNFPGNVRELRNMAERALMLCKGTQLEIDDFQIETQKPDAAGEGEAIVGLQTLEEGMIRKALQKYKYNQQAAADALGIHRDALSRKLKKYNITINRIGD